MDLFEAAGKVPAGTKAAQVAVLHVRPDVSAGLIGSGGDPYPFAARRSDWSGSEARIGVFFHDASERRMAFGLAVVRPRATRGEADRMILATGFIAVDEIDFTDARGELAAASGADGPIPDNLGSALLVGITESNPEAAKAVEVLNAKIAAADGSAEALRLRDERDAALLLAKFASAGNLPVSRWSSTAEGAPYLSGLRQDSVKAKICRRRQAPWVENVSISWPAGTEWFYHEPNTRSSSSILIANAVPNPVKAKERGTAQLIYYHQKSGTLVQCSYLRILSGGPLRPDLDRSSLEILSSNKLAQGSDGEENAVDLQFVRDSRFVKLTGTEPVDPTSKKPTAGRIFPVEMINPFVTTALAFPKKADPTVVPVELPFPRHLTHTQFADLVRCGWLGMRRIPIKGIIDVIQQSLDATGSVVLGIDLSSRSMPGNS